MDTRSTNRLLPQSMLSTTTHSPTTRHVPQKLTLRRRCRSECLQMTPIVGLPTEPKHFDDLNELRRKAPQHHQQQHNHHQQQPVFRNMLFNCSPTSAIRNQQDRAKNIFSFVDNRSRNGGCGGGGGNNLQLKNNTKENISSAPSILTHSTAVAANGIICSGSSTVDKDLCMRDFELYREKAIRSNREFINKYQCIDKASYDNCGTINDRKTDNNKRRVRARSESEPHELYQTKQHSPNKFDRNKGYGDVSTYFNFVNYLLLTFTNLPFNLI